MEKPTQHCQHCGKLFLQRRPWSRFCSPTCRNQYHITRRKMALKVFAENETKN